MLHYAITPKTLPRVRLFQNHVPSVCVDSRSLDPLAPVHSSIHLMANRSLRLTLDSPPEQLLATIAKLQKALRDSKLELARIQAELETERDRRSTLEQILHEGDWRLERLDVEPHTNEYFMSQSLLEKGKLCFASNDYGAAIKCFREFLRSQQSDPSVLLSLGHAYLGNLEYENAKDVLECAVAMETESNEKSGCRLVNLYVSLGAALFHSGKIPDALCKFQQALLLDPQSCLATIGVGKVLQSKGSQSAVNHFFLATRLDSSNRSAWENLSACEFDLGLLSSSRKHRSQADILPVQFSLFPIGTQPSFSAWAPCKSLSLPRDCLVMCSGNSRKRRASSPQSQASKARTSHHSIRIEQSSAECFAMLLDSYVDALEVIGNPIQRFWDR